MRGGQGTEPRHGQSYLVELPRGDGASAWNIEQEPVRRHSRGRGRARAGAQRIAGQVHDGAPAFIGGAADGGLSPVASSTSTRPVCALATESNGGIDPAAGRAHHCRGSRPAEGPPANLVRVSTWRKECHYVGRSFTPYSSPLRRGIRPDCGRRAHRMDERPLLRGIGPASARRAGLPPARESQPRRLSAARRTGSRRALQEPAGNEAEIIPTAAGPPIGSAVA